MKIIYGKKLFTFDSKDTISEAIAFDEEKIIKIGTKDELVKAFPNAKLIDQYQNEYIYPAWVEPHSHIVYAAILIGLCTYIDVLDWEFSQDWKYEPALSSNEFYKRIKQEVTKNPDKEYYLFLGWNKLLLGELDVELVKQITDKPMVIITSSTHIWYTFNGMDEILELKDQDDNVFGIIKNEKGERIAYSEQAALKALVAIGKMMQKKPNILQKGLEGILYQSKKYGVSSMTEHAQGLVDPELEDVIMKNWVEKTAKNQIRLVSLPWLQNWIGKYKTLKETYDQMESRQKKFIKGKDNYYYDRWIKLHFDGAIKDEQVKLSMNFNGSDDSGEWNYSRMDQILNDVKYFWDRGYSCSFHTQGDGAYDEFMKIYDELTKTTPKGDKKFRIEHLGFPPTRFFEWLKSKNDDDRPEISVFPLYTHLYSKGFEDSNYIPAIIRNDLNRTNSAIKANALVSIHNDIPNAPTNPLFAAWAAVERKTLSGDTYRPEERITREQALKAITINAAIMTKIGDITGSLEVGKKADINILSKDLFECDIDEWKDLPSLQTYFEGKEIK